MTNVNCIAQEKSGVNHLTLTPANKTEEKSLGIIDGALVLGFMAAFVGLVFLLSK